MNLGFLRLSDLKLQQQEAISEGMVDPELRQSDPQGVTGHTVIHISKFAHGIVPIAVNGELICKISVRRLETLP